MNKQGCLALGELNPSLQGINQLSGKGNAYLFEAQGLLVDTGAPGDLERLEILPPVESVLLTHTHPCHIGGLKRVWRAYSPRVLCSEEGIEEVVRQGVAPEKITPLKGNESLAFGTLSFRVVPSPGHSPDSIALYETGNTILLSGDAVFTEGGDTPSLPAGADPAEWAESVRFLSTLGANILLPGHGTVKTGEVVETIVETYAHLQGEAESSPLMGAIAGGIQYADLEMMPQALTMFDQVLQAEPKHPGAAFSKGLTLLKMSRFQEAIECFDLALEVVPNFKEAANAKALAQSAVKDVMPKGTRRGR